MASLSDALRANTEALRLAREALASARARAREHALTGPIRYPDRRKYNAHMRTLNQAIRALTARESALVLAQNRIAFFM